MKDEIVKQIKERILDEQRKHSNLDWAHIAALKIYATFLDNQSEWISVEDGLPELNEDVLVYEKDGHCSIYACCFTKILGFKSHSSLADCVTYWQPLPSPPNKDIK